MDKPDAELTPLEVLDVAHKADNEALRLVFMMHQNGMPWVTCMQIAALHLARAVKQLRDNYIELLNRTPGPPIVVPLKQFPFVLKSKRD